MESVRANIEMFDELIKSKDEFINSDGSLNDQEFRKSHSEWFLAELKRSINQADDALDKIEKPNPNKEVLYSVANQIMEEKIKKIHTLMNQTNQR